MLEDFVTPVNLPESPFSTNAYVEIAGVKHQITARGLTATEMTTNFFAAVDTLKAAYEARSARPVIDAGKLLALVGCWVQRATDLNDLPLITRILKAAQLVQAGAVTRENQEEYTVTSQADPQKSYWTTGSTCTCEDAAHHANYENYFCKHQLSVRLFEKLMTGV